VAGNSKCIILPDFSRFDFTPTGPAISINNTYEKSLPRLLIK
jgi:hypothetical protein